MTVPQDTHGFTSQLVMWFGSASTAIFSAIRVTEAISAISEVTAQNQPKTRSRVNQGAAVSGRGDWARSGADATSCAMVDLRWWIIGEHLSS